MEMSSIFYNIFCGKELTNPHIGYIIRIEKGKISNGYA